MDSAAAGTTQNKLLKLTRKRLERFVTLLPKVLISDDPEAIHQLRVWSRRLQQALRVVLDKAKPQKGRKVRRTLRDVRRVLGPCRNLDVNIELIMERRKHASAALVQQSWDAIRNELEEKRAPLLERARRTVARYNVFDFIERAQALIDAADRDSDPIKKLNKATAQSMKAWDEAFALAYERRDETHLHKFRIAAKRLRYRAELLGDLGESQAKPLVQHLKELQTALGEWHDRCVLMHYVAEFIGQPNFLADHPDMGRALLAEIEKEKLRNEAAIDTILSHAPKVQKSWAGWKPGPDTPQSSGQ